MQSRIDVNAFPCLAATMAMGVIGPCVFIVQPGFVQGMVAYLGFSEARAGEVASVEMWGIAITTVVMTFFAHRFDWRRVCFTSLLVMAASNLVSIFLADPLSFSIARFAAGVGAGSLISLSFTIVGLTAKTDRNFGLYIMFVLIYGAIVLPLMPWAYGRFGFSGILVFFALLSLAGLPLVSRLPRRGEEHVALEADAAELARPLKALALAAMFAYFLGMGVVWAYLFLIGVSGGIAEQQVANALAMSQVGGVLGAFTTVVVGRRFGRELPLTVGISGTAVPVVLLLAGFGALKYAGLVFVFNYAWNVTHPFLLAAMASFDRSGRMVTLAVAAQMMGLANGPWIAAQVLDGANFSRVIWLGAGLFGLSLVLVLPPVIRHRAETAPSGAGLTEETSDE